MKKAKLDNYVDYIVKNAVELLSVDSPTGYTDNAAGLLMEKLSKLGYKPEKTVKGGVLVKLSDGKNPASGGIMFNAHIDTLGAMVSKIKDNGRLSLTPLGGMNANNSEAENVRIVTRFSGEFEGTCQIEDASVHVNPKYDETKREWANMEIVIDEDVKSKDDVLKLGISVGDIVCFDPRTRVTSSGYIKSRFLDDKLSAAILTGFAKYLRDEQRDTEADIWVHFTVFEEVGHGASATVPAGVTHIILVDMGCIGEGLSCTERQVSICAKDSGGPYAYDVVKSLIEAALRAGADYAVDVYPRYGSDVEAALGAGYDIKHGLIGPGVYASHGYERSHKAGVENTLRLLLSYAI